MAQQYFLDLENLLDLLLDELPEGVFATDLADDPDASKRSYSSAELRAAAAVLADAYVNLSLVNDDKNVSTATPDGLTRWEKELFKDAQDSTLTTAARKQNLIAKLRSSGGITLPALTSIVAGILTPLGLAFRVIPWSGQRTPDGVTGAWLLDVSALDQGTYLSLRDPARGDESNTADQTTEMRRTAYTYEVAIYGHASQQTLVALEKQLTQYEPARSQHLIRNDAALPIDAGPIDAGIYLAQVPWR